MFDIVNPYNALVFYKNRTDESKRCPIYAPRFLTTFQIPVSLTDANFAISLVSLTDNEIPIDSPDLTDSTVDGKRYITFRPVNDVVSSDGIYQIKFVSDELTYWSHALAIRNRFGQLVQSVSCAGSAANFELQLTSKGCDWALWECDAGSGFVRIGQDTGIVNTALVGERAGAVSLPVKCTFVTDTQIVTRTYNLTYTGEDPCSDATLTQTGTTTERTETNRFLFLLFSHDKNFEEKNINYVQSGYTQRFYFEANFGHSTRIEEEGFQTLSDGALSFDYANEANQINVDIFPCADYLLNGLNQARYHSTCRVVDAQTLEPYDIQNFKLVSSEVDGSECQRSVMTFEINRVYSKV